MIFKIEKKICIANIKFFTLLYLYLAIKKSFFLVILF